MMEIDEAIGQVENLYRAVTGNDFPQGTETQYAPIPAEHDPAAHVKEQMDRLLRALAEPTSQIAMQASANARPWCPAVTFCETATDLLVCVDLPGVSRDRIDVRVDGACLVIAGSRPVTMGSGTRSRVFGEQQFGNFRRDVVLPPGLKTADLGAQLKDGVLVVRIPRNAEASRAVPIS